MSTLCVWSSSQPQQLKEDSNDSDAFKSQNVISEKGNKKERG